MPHKNTTTIYFKYPSVKELKDFTPKERVVYIQKKFQQDYKAISLKLTGQKFELLGTQRKPRGIKLKVDEKTFQSLLKLNYVDKTFSSVSSKRVNAIKIIEPFYCFKVIFQIQIEGRTKGIQTYEERFILVKGKNWDQAEAKVIKTFKDKADPYLNSDGQLVRWKFESIEESYHTFIESNDDFDKPVEVFSKLKTRKLKKEHIWLG